MEEQYKKFYSKCLDRDMEYSVYGNSGKVCFVFPVQNGRFYDYKDFGMTDIVMPYIDAGKIQLVCVDGIDGESWSNKAVPGRQRIEQQEKWFHYVVDELVPLYVKNGEKAMVTGCSMGGVHSGIFFFRRPDIFDTMLALSGTFDASFFFDDYFDNLVYDNSPVHFLPNMPEDHPWMDLYRKSTIISCIGQGRWEGELLVGTRACDAILTQKGIPHWFDYWGFDVDHDWCWWKKQLIYFLNYLFGEA